MISFIIKRLLAIVPILLAISLMIFYVMYLSKSDPAIIILGDLASREAREEVYRELGLDQPFFTQYFNYMGGVFRGDFGRSYITKQPVTEIIASKFPNTLLLAILAWTFSLIGIPLGIISAVKRYSLVDMSGLVSAMIFSSTPNFVIGLIFLLVFSLRLRWFPAMANQQLISYILPAIVLSTNWLAMNLRMTRSSMLEVIRMDYVSTARVKGAREFRVIVRHCLRNALLPVVTVLGMNFAIMLSGAAVVETVFTIPGIGILLVDAIQRNDTPIVMGIVLMSAFFIGISNLIVDIVYGFIDPRIKTDTTIINWRKLVMNFRLKFGLLEGGKS